MDRFDRAFVRVFTIAVAIILLIMGAAGVIAIHFLAKVW